MNKTTRTKACLTYIALVVAAFAAHACAVERDQQATPTATATRSA